MSYCIAKRDDGAICHQPAATYDPLRMGDVCGAHAPSEPPPEVFADVRAASWGIVIARDTVTGTFTAVARDVGAAAAGGLLVVGNDTADEALRKAFEFVEHWSGSSVTARSLRAMAKVEIARKAAP